MHVPPAVLAVGAILLCVALYRVRVLHRRRQNEYARVALYEAADKEELAFATMPASAALTPTCDRFSMAASERLLETPTTARSMASAAAEAIASSGRGGGGPLWHRCASARHGARP